MTAQLGGGLQHHVSARPVSVICSAPGICLKHAIVVYLDSCSLGNSDCAAAVSSLVDASASPLTASRHKAVVSSGDSRSDWSQSMRRYMCTCRLQLSSAG